MPTPTSIQELAQNAIESLNRELLFELVNANRDLIEEVLRPLDWIRTLAFFCVEKEHIDLLNHLITVDRELLTAISQSNGQTLLLRACHYINEQSVNCLLENGADPNLANFHGNTPAMTALYKNTFPNKQDYDFKSLAILKALKQFGADFSIKDNDNDNALIEAIRADLPNSTNFLIEALQQAGNLRQELYHANNSSTTAYSLLLGNPKLYDAFSLKLQPYLPSKEETLTQLLEIIVTQGTYSDSTEQQVKGLLLHVDKNIIQSLTKKIFVKKVCNPEMVHTPFNNHDLLKEKPYDVYGNKIFTSKDVRLIKLLAVAGADISMYKDLITKLCCITKEAAKKAKGSISSAVIFTEDQQEILNLIEANNAISKGDIVISTKNDTLIKELAIEKFFFLIQKDALGIIAEISQLTNVTNFIAKNSYKMDVSELFQQIITRAPGIETVNNIPKSVYSKYPDYIKKIAKNPNVLSEIANAPDQFLQNLDTITLEIQKILDPNFSDQILPRGVALNNLPKGTIKLIPEDFLNLEYQNTYNNLKNGSIWFKSIASQEIYCPVSDETSPFTSKYYQEHPEALIPGLLLSHILQNNSQQLETKLLEPLTQISDKTDQILSLNNCINTLVEQLKRCSPTNQEQIDIIVGGSRKVLSDCVNSPELHQAESNYQTSKELLTHLETLSGLTDLHLNTALRSIIQNCLKQYYDINQSIEKVDLIIQNLNLDVVDIDYSTDSHNNFNPDIELTENQQNNLTELSAVEFSAAQEENTLGGLESPLALSM